MNDGHSLYLETGAELGLVGLGLVVFVLGALLVALARRCRGDQRALFAAALAAGLAWALHSGVDWDWEVPATTCWLFALGGLGLAREAGGPVAEPPRGLRVAIGLVLVLLAVTPITVAFSQVRLDESVRAFRSGDCERSIDAALASARAAPSRPEPLQMLGFCDARSGLANLSVELMREAAARDPRNWEFHYSLAVVQAYAGRDPRPAMSTARRLNPREPLVRQGQARFATHDPRAWRQEAARAPLPFQSRPGSG